MIETKLISHRSIVSFIVCFLVFTLAAPVTVFAAGSIDINQDVSLMVNYKDGTTPVTGVNFSVYKIADVNEQAKMTLTEQFSSYPVDMKGLDQDGWQNLVTTLEGYVKRDKLTAFATAVTGTDGSFNLTMKPGLYMVTGEKKKVGSYTYTPKSFIIFLPESCIDENSWNYEVAADVKYSKESNPGKTKTVSRKALKIWDDKGYENKRPESVTVQLLRNGSVYDTQKLTEANSWRYTWDKLNDKYEWTVVEKEIEGYTTTVNQEGITFTVTNKYVVPPDDPPDNPPDNPPDDPPVNPPDNPPHNPSDNPPKTPSDKNVTTQKLPQTGTLWWPVPALILAGLVLCIMGIRNRRMHEDEQ